MYARKEEIQLLLRLEAELERNDEGAVDLWKHESLSESVRDLVPIHCIHDQKPHWKVLI